MSEDAHNRNPFVIPEEKPLRRRGCPKCGSVSVEGRKDGATMGFTCTACGNTWAGGLAIEPVRRIPVTNPKDRPPLEFDRTSRGELYEINNPQDPTPDFRRGALIPEDDDPYGW